MLSFTVSEIMPSFFQIGIGTQVYSIIWQAMLKINEDMHNIWKNQVREKSSQSSISSWIMNLPFDTKVKEWVAAEEKYKQEVQMKNILPAVADKFLVDQQAGQVGASILCFDEIQVYEKKLRENSYCYVCFIIVLFLIQSR